VSGVKEPIKGRKMNQQNRAMRSIDLEGNEGERISEGKASRDSGKGKEIMRTQTLRKSNPPHQQSRLKWYSQSRNFHSLRGQRGRMSSPSFSVWMRLLRELAGQTRSGFSPWPLAR